MEMEDYEGKNALWSGILRFRYINPELKMFTDDGRMTRRGDSIWWKDLLRVELKDGVHLNFFSNNILCILENRSGISFWHSN